MVNGTVFSVEEFSVFDGPGIRTSIFLKGCPLRCTWCHNPEGQSFDECIVRSPNGCIGCNACIDYAIKEGEEFIFTEESIKKCPMNLLRRCGEKISSGALAAHVMKNERILKNGGVTFSGGEPLAQGEFLADCLDRFKGKLHTAVQTSGFGEEEIFKKVLKKSDYFLYDLKIVDDAVHKMYTGVSNELILNNFKLLVQSGKEFVIRIPLIPTVTDTVENITSIAEVLSKNKVFYAELLPYNKMAGGKYKMLMREYSPKFNTQIAPETRDYIFEKFKIRTKIL